MKGFCRKTVFVAGLALCAAALFAAGSKDAGAAKAQKKVRIMHFMSPTQADANDKAFAASLAKFRSENPDFAVEDEFIQHDNYEVKIKTMIAAKDLPDVYYSKPDLFPVLRENGLIMSVDELLSADPAFAKTFKDGAFNDFTVEGKTWGFPFQLQSNHVVYYNKEIFRKAGVAEFPKTMEGFEEAVKKIRAAGFVPIAMGNKGKWLMPSCIFNTMVYRYTDAAWFASLYNKSGAKFTDAPFVEAAKLTARLVASGAFNKDMNSIDNNQQRVLFYSGEAAMFIEGSWALAAVIENASSALKPNLGVAVLPPVAGKESFGNTVAGGAGWAICINPKNLTDERKAAVFAFVKQMYGQFYADTAAANGGFPAIVPNINEASLDPLQVAYGKLPLKFAPIFDVQLPSKIVDVFYNDMQELLQGLISPEEYARRVEAVNR